MLAELGSRAFNPAALCGGRHGTWTGILPELHLDEDDPFAAPGNQVDLADRPAPAAGQDPVADQYQIDKGDALGGAALPVSALPVEKRKL